MNQRYKILERLQRGGWFSLADALNMNPPVYRLSERIRELEKKGYRIEHRRAEGKTYEEYRLKQSDIVSKINAMQVYRTAPVVPPENKEQKLFA